MMNKPYFWWPLLGTLSLISLSFALFGINLLVATYGLKNPFHFVMTFFSASFIILTGFALFAGFVARMIKRYRQPSNTVPDK